MRIHTITDDDADVSVELHVDAATGQVPELRLLSKDDGHELLRVTAANGFGVTATHLRRAEEFLTEATLVTAPRPTGGWVSPAEPETLRAGAAAPVRTRGPGRKTAAKKATGRPSSRPADAVLEQAFATSSVADVARRFGVAASTASNWKRQLGDQPADA